MWQIPLDSRSTIAADAGTVYLLTSANHLACVDKRTGTVRAKIPLPGATGWTAYSMYVTDGFVVVERVNPDARDRDGDRSYYYGSRPVVLATC